MVNPNQKTLSQIVKEFDEYFLIQNLPWLLGLPPESQNAAITRVASTAAYEHPVLNYLGQIAQVLGINPVQALVNAENMLEQIRVVSGLQTELYEENKEIGILRQKLEKYSALGESSEITRNMQTLKEYIDTIQKNLGVGSPQEIVNALTALIVLNNSYKQMGTSEDIKKQLNKGVEAQKHLTEANTNLIALKTKYQLALETLNQVETNLGATSGSTSGNLVELIKEIVKEKQTLLAEKELRQNPLLAYASKQEEGAPQLSLNDAVAHMYEVIVALSGKQIIVSSSQGGLNSSHTYVLDEIVPGRVLTPKIAIELSAEIRPTIVKSERAAKKYRAHLEEAQKQVKTQEAYQLATRQTLTKSQDTSTIENLLKEMGKNGARLTLEADSTKVLAVFDQAYKMLFQLALSGVNLEDQGLGETARTVCMYKGVTSLDPKITYNRAAEVMVKQNQLRVNYRGSNSRTVTPVTLS